MTKRKLQIVRATYPLAGACEQCNARFVSRNENLEIAAQHIREQFEIHKCQTESGYNDSTKNN